MAQAPSQPRELPKKGQCNAVCIGFIDLGLQESNNPDWEPQRKCMVIFETDIKRTDGKFFQLSKQFTFSMSPKGNLYKTLNAWLDVKSKSFDMDDMLGQGASLLIKHEEGKNGSTYANIGVVMPGGKKALKPSVKPYSLYLTDEFDQKVFDSLTDYTKGLIMDSDTYKEMLLGGKKSKSVAPAKKAKKK